MARNTKEISINRFHTRALSYSQLSSFEWNREEWYTNYILGVREPANPAMLFGSLVGDSIGTPDSLVPALVPPGVKEYALSATLGDIPLVGYADHWCATTRTLSENKTSSKQGQWNQKKVDAHGQLTMYALMLFLREKVKPEDVTFILNFIPVEIGGDFNYRMPDPVVVHSFETRRTTQEILEYSAYILKTVALMDKYIKSHF